MSKRKYEKANVTWLNELDKYVDYVVYLLTVIEDGITKYYIGQTTMMLCRRIQDYKSIIPNPNRLIEQAINKTKHFTVEILCKCSSKDELNVKEREYTLLYRSNEREFGYNDSIGRKMSAEYCRKMGVTKKGNTYCKGKKRSVEDCKRNGETHSIKCKSIPDNIIFDSITLCVEYYVKKFGSLAIKNYLDNGKIHKKSGQTFVRIKD